MSDYETCPACNFQIPMNASACGHCGRDLYRYVEYDTSFFGRLWAAIKRGILFFILCIILQEPITDYMGITPAALGLLSIGLISYGFISGFKKGNKGSYISSRR